MFKRLRREIVELVATRLRLQAKVIGDDEMGQVVEAHAASQYLPLQSLRVRAVHALGLPLADEVLEFDDQHASGAALARHVEAGLPRLLDDPRDAPLRRVSQPGFV